MEMKSCASSIIFSRSISWSNGGTVGRSCMNTLRNIRRFNMTAEELRTIRLELKLSQYQFAQLLGLSPEYICRLEKQRVPMSRQFVWRLYAILNRGVCPTCGQTLPRPL